MMNLRFSQALPEDARLLTEIAQLSKGHWQYPLHWIEAWLPQLTVTAEFISKHPTVRAHIETQTIGFYALSQTEPTSDLIHFWLLPGFIGRGFGRVMFLDAVARARAGGVTTLRIESDPHAEGFYRCMGCIRVASSFSTLHGQQRELPVLQYSTGR
ncbi:MAG: GNAT family N-acetyltransferase [Verrucomicrobiaceae bacterium]|nr:GNAT family N-acetyltransferase [Verrucomicrobiaceae bacterium]